MTEGKRKRLLGPDEIDRAIEEVAQVAAEEGIQALLVGGCALHFYGSDRLTADVDVAADRMAEGLPRGRPLTFGGFKSRSPSGVPLDWIVRDDDFTGVYEEALQYGRRLEGVPIPVASPEYLAAMKMVAGRGKDEEDLRALIQSGELDAPKARKMIKRLLGAYAAKEFDSFVAEAEWLKEREQGEGDE